MDTRHPLDDGGYHGQIDAFGVYCPQNGMVYLILREDVPAVTYARLRLDPPLNGQTTGIRWAHKYKIGKADVELVDLTRPGS
jgi:PD-(D/E)XK endonuclease